MALLRHDSRPLMRHRQSRAANARMLVAAAFLISATVSHADAVTREADPAPNATANLVRIMLEKNVITREQADELIAQSKREAEAARASAPPAPNTAAPSKDGVVRVTYVPESVKEQLREDIRQEVMARAKAENWAAPNQTPEWAKHMRVSGDLRFRYEHQSYPNGNDATGAFPNFNQINNGAPYDVSASNPNFAPQYNVDQDRNRYRLRARFGAEIDLEEDFTAGIRLATGETNSPVTANQTVNSFSRYSVWVDRAFLKFEPAHGHDQSLSISVGRFDNPFFCSTLTWAYELGFDGVALNARYDIGETVAPFITAGAFPIYNTDLNFASNQPSKFQSRDKWLYAGQMGSDIKLGKELTFKVAAAYYCFENVEGELSSPYIPLGANDAGDTDDSRPTFAQRGNTYMALRNITPDASNGFGTTNQYQYFGLASPFREAVLTSRLDCSSFNPFHIIVDGEFVKNLAYSESAIAAKAINNRGASGYEGGDIGWQVGLTFGHPVLEKRGDWQIGVGYKYVESDAVVDGFTDSDFGGGGTNLQGYTLSGSMAVAKRVSVRARWMSGESIAGPTYRADTFQFDISARF